MGFKSLLEGQVQNLMLTLGQEDGLAPAQTYLVAGGQTYDPTTRTNVTTNTTVSDVPMVLAKFQVNDADDKVVIATDAKAIIAALDLPGISPKEQDNIVVSEGANIPAGTYDVFRVMGVPGKSVHILHIRRNA